MKTRHLRELQKIVRPPRPEPPPPAQPDGPPIGEIIGAVLARVQSPPVFGQSRGIVTAAGGEVLLTNAYVLFRLLRHLGCTLPIECWQLPHERDAVWQRLVEPLGVRIVDARARGFVGSPFADHKTITFHRHTRPSYRRDMLDGYALKSYSLMHCDFRQALWLDGDNCPIRDPAEAFGWPEFRNGPGYVCWPDADHSHNSGFALPNMAAFGLPELREAGTLDMANGCETGQVLADKTRLHVWAALSLGNWMSENASYFYVHSWGEKEVPSVSARLAGFEPTIIPHAATLSEGVCVQRDFRGDVFTFHRFGQSKWRREGEQIRPTGFPWQRECEGWLAELAAKWSPAA